MPQAGGWVGRRETGVCESRELSQSPGRPGEGQGATNKALLDPQIGQHLRTRHFTRQTGLQHTYAMRKCVFTAAPRVVAEDSVANLVE